MVALLQRLGILSAPDVSDVAPRQVEKDSLSQDQIAYLHELAAERRKTWMAHKREA